MTSSECEWAGNTSLMTMANGEVMPWYQMCPATSSATTQAVASTTSAISHQITASITSPVVSSLMSTATSPTSRVGGALNAAGATMGEGQCQMSSMLWNWQTIDACFISSQWHIRTSGQFAGTCISVVAWGILLQGLLRMQREFDRFLLNRWRSASSASHAPYSASPNIDNGLSSADDDSREAALSGKSSNLDLNGGFRSSPVQEFFSTPTGTGEQRFQLKIWQQAIRAWLHAVDFGASYLFMLMAMYYNGYVLICMFIGQLIGYLIFSWDTVGDEMDGSGSPESCCK